MSNPTLINELRQPLPPGYSPAWIWAKDEVPKIGSGIRPVFAKIGRKWVLIRPVTNPTAVSTRVLKSTWDRIVMKERNTL